MLVVFSGPVCLHSELPNVHILGSALLIPGCDAGQGLCSICLWIRNTRGNSGPHVVTPICFISIFSSVTD